MPPSSPGAAPDEEPSFGTVIEVAGNRLLAAVNPAAEAAGLAPGMKLADARSFLPGFATLPADPAADGASLHALAEWCGRYSPWTAPDAADAVRLEITGCAHLWGGEEALAADLAGRLARQGIAARIAVADTLGAAWAVARHGAAAREAAIVAPGGQQARLGPLPIAALRLDPACIQGLRRVGLKRVADLYPMPRAALARRFGEDVATRLDQALDRLPEPLSPMAEAPSLRVRLSFAEPIADPADLDRATERLAARLCAGLERDGMGARRLDLAFHRVDGRVERIRLGTARPTRDPRHLAALLREKRETVDPGLGIEDMILAAPMVEPFTAEQPSLAPLLPTSSHEGRRSVPASPALLPTSSHQGRRSVPASPAPSSSPGGRRPGGGGDRSAAEPTPSPPTPPQESEAVARLLDRLGARLGLDALSRIEPRQSHVPERAAIRVFPTAAQPMRTSLVLPDRPPRPIRLFDPPEPVSDVLWLLPDDPPSRFTWRRRDHRVVRADGPERIAAEWWRLDPPTLSNRLQAELRDYYRVEDVQGQRFWLFRAGLPDLEGRPWFVHGLFA